MKAGKRRIIREAWRLAKPYWTSEEKWSASGLLLAIVVLNLGNVYVGIRINQWNPRFGCLLSGHRRQVERVEGCGEAGKGCQTRPKLFCRICDRSRHLLRMNGSGDCSL